LNKRFCCIKERKKKKTREPIELLSEIEQCLVCLPKALYTKIATTDTTSFHQPRKRERKSEMEERERAEGGGITKNRVIANAK
jgi:hypothetical protein